MQTKKATETVLIVGYGISGMSSAKLLSRKGYKVALYDDREDILFDNNDYQDRRNLRVDKLLQDISFCVISPSVALDNKVVVECKARGIEVISELELGYRFAENEIIAVTGTNGKTTTTLLIQAILKESGLDAYALGNIGLALTDKVDEIDKKAVIVLETSSFQLESTSDFCPEIAVCLNVTPDHLERHKTFEEYVRCKKKIFENQTDKDYAVLNYDDDTVRDFASDIKSKIYYFAKGKKVKGAYTYNEEIYFNGGCRERVLCKIDELSLKGEHNIENSLAAITATKLLGVDDKVIAKVLKSFTPLRYRMQFIADIDGSRVYNDSKATNIDATIKACNSLKGDVTLIVGGYDKKISYQSFYCQLPSNVKHIVGVGDNVYAIKQEMPEEKWYTFEIAHTLEKAFETAINKQTPNILFSPTTSSFDRYTGYIQRGEAFDKVVKGYLQ